MQTMMGREGEGRDRRKRGESRKGGDGDGAPESEGKGGIEGDITSTQPKLTHERWKD